MKLLRHLVLTLVLSGLLGAALVSLRTPDFRGVNGLETGPAADLADLIRQSTIKRSQPVEISETDLNRYLAAIVAGRQDGWSANGATFDRVIVDLEPGRARVTLCWKIRDHVSTSAVDLEVRRTQDKKTFEIEVRGGAYGRLPVHRGFMVPTSTAFASLASACEAEIKALFQMTRIDIEKDKLVLDPRFL